METQKNQVAERLKKATNILVAVSTNPTVDQLAGAIGLTLLLNKLNKHATAVFSGKVPSTLEFLQPDKTLEKNTDSLRDFIIALDKSKADKLRYKVEDEMVKIFITPYMTSISDKDLEFSQGDFNVEVVLALGVNEQQDLDQAITSNGRILHDATVMSVSTHTGGSLGSINWVDEAASSLCEMLVSLGLALKEDVLDGQMATALLTGIVAETNRFSNEKTSSETMQMSAKLMTAGANQQLVASQLQPPTPKQDPKPDPEPVTPQVEENATEEVAESEDLQLPEIQDSAEPEDDEPEPPQAPPPAEEVDGTLQISHGSEAEDSKTEQPLDTQTTKEPTELSVEQIHIDEEGTLKPLDSASVPPASTDDPKSDLSGSSGLILDPPSLGGTLTANSKPEELEPSSDILGATDNQGPILSHDNDSNVVSDTEVIETVPLPPLPAAEPVPIITPPVPLPPDEPAPQTLSDLEDLVTGSKVSEPIVEAYAQEAETPSSTPTTDVNAARDAVTQAVAGGSSQVLPPVQALNAQPMDLNLGDMPAVSTSLASAFASNSSAPSLDDASLVTNEPVISPALVPLEPPSATGGSHILSMDPNAPPPVPPPMMPPGEQSLLYGQQPLPNAEDDNTMADPIGPI